MVATIIVSTVEVLVISHHDSPPASTGMSVGALHCWSFKRSKAFGVFWNTKVSFVIETLPFLAWKGWVEVVSRILGTGMILLILHTFSGYAGFSGSTVSLIFMLYTAAKKFWLCLSRIIEIYSNSNTQGMLNYIVWISQPPETETRIEFLLQDV